MAILGPFSVAYPVNFVSQGDTTKEAFHKHIQEIEAIYGILNSLDSDKVSASEVNTKFTQIDNSVTQVKNDLTSHINNSNPHPNWKINLGSQTEGSLDGSKISGVINNATIPYGNVTGLTSYINGLDLGNGDGITSISKNANGYVVFNNGFTIIWGVRNFSSSQTNDTSAEFTQTFSKSFPTACLSVNVNLGYEVTLDGDRQVFALLRAITKNNFKFQLLSDTSSEKWSNLILRYIALGY